MNRQVAGCLWAVGAAAAVVSDLGQLHPAHTASSVRHSTLAVKLCAVCLCHVVLCCAAAASIPGWWIWIYWLSPFSYALRAIVINEMTNERWSAPAPGNPYGLTLGEEGLHTFGFYTERYWIWVGESARCPCPASPLWRLCH